MRMHFRTHEIILLEFDIKVHNYIDEMKCEILVKVSVIMIY